MTTKFPVLALVFAWLVTSVISARAAAELVAVKVPLAKAYVGQRLPFFVELRSKGPFGGATSFTLPEVPGSILVKVGDPVVSSDEVDGQSWFVQTHEFALFSQHEGPLRIPEFPVRFGSREAISGPVMEMEAKVPMLSVEIERPAGTDPQRFLVTAQNFSVEERWNPVPSGEVKTGAVFKRTITQSADDMTGMALAPAPTTAPEGIHVYPGNPEVEDKTERGDFSGQRTETLTYLVERPGTYTLPAIRYDWWNPEPGRLESKTLPAVRFTAIASPEIAAKPASERWFLVGGILAVAAGLTALGWYFRLPVQHTLQSLWNRIDPPERRAERAFLRACRRNDARAAAHAWTSLRDDVPADEALHGLIIDLQRHLYGASASPDSWNGSALARAFRHRSRKLSVPTGFASLPPLNP